MIGIQIATLSVLTLVKYLDKNFCIKAHKSGRKIISFLVGAAITLLFTEVLNEAYREIHLTNELLILVLPVAFFVSMLVKEHINNQKGLRAKREKSLHASIVSFISGILLGLIVYGTTSIGVKETALMLATLVVYELVSDLSIHIYHEKTFGRKNMIIKKALHSASPFYGFLIGALANLGELISIILVLGFSGTFLYIIFEEIIPKEKDLNIKNFLIGMLILTVIFLLNSNS